MPSAIYYPTLVPSPDSISPKRPYTVLAMKKKMTEKRRK
jgi:hypothetical protein